MPGGKKMANVTRKGMKVQRVKRAKQAQVLNEEGGVDSDQRG